MEVTYKDHWSQITITIIIIMRTFEILWELSKYQVHKVSTFKKKFFCSFFFSFFKSLSHAQLFATPKTVAHQAPLSMGFSRQQYWSALSFPSPGDLPDPGIELMSPIWAEGVFTNEPSGKPWREHIPLDKWCWWTLLTQGCYEIPVNCNKVNYDKMRYACRSTSHLVSIPSVFSLQNVHRK